MRTTVDLLRHGEAAPGLCLGRDFDPPLTELGWAQMRGVLGAGLAPWDGVACSPLARCADFAGELARRHGLLLRPDPRWRELGFGAWEGRPWSELYAQEGGSLLAFQQNPGFHPAPGGEHYWDFEARLAAAWAGLLESARGGHWLLVAHGGVVRGLLRLLLGFPPARLFAVQVPHACLTRLVQEEGGPPRLVFHGGGL